MLQAHVHFLPASPGRGWETGAGTRAGVVPARPPTWQQAGRARHRLTLHLGLVDEEVFGSAAALKLLASAFLGAELLVLALVQSEECGGEATAAGGPGQGRQRVLLWGWAEGGQPVAPAPSPMADPSSAPCTRARRPGPTVQHRAVCSILPASCSIPRAGCTSSSLPTPKSTRAPTFPWHSQAACWCRQQCTGRWCSRQSRGTSFVSFSPAPRLLRAHGWPCGSLAGVSKPGVTRPIWWVTDDLPPGCGSAGLIEGLWLFTSAGPSSPGSNGKVEPAMQQPLVFNWCDSLFPTVLCWGGHKGRTGLSPPAGLSLPLPDNLPNFN